MRKHHERSWSHLSRLEFQENTQWGPKQKLYGGTREAGVQVCPSHCSHLAQLVSLQREGLWLQEGSPAPLLPAQRQKITSGLLWIQACLIADTTYFWAIYYHLVAWTLLDTSAMGSRTLQLLQLRVQTARSNSESGPAASRGSPLQQAANYVTACLWFKDIKDLIGWDEETQSTCHSSPTSSARAGSGHQASALGIWLSAFAAYGFWERLQCLGRDQVSLPWEETVWS